MDAARRRHRRTLARASVCWSAGVLLALLIGAFAFPLGCGHDRPPPPTPAGPPIVRVRIASDTTQVRLTASAVAKPVSVRTSTGQARRLNLPTNSPVPVTLTAAGWQVGTTTLPAGPQGAGELTVEPEPAGSVAIADGAAGKTDGNGKADAAAKAEARPYRGSLRFVPTARADASQAKADASQGRAGAFDVVNHVPVDDYLKGVLSAELYPEFHPEAYKAQAIAARTYAIYAARTSPDNRHWDLHSDTRSQMYGGVRSETPKAVAAAAETAGVVLAFGPDGQERIFKAYYSSCCGGATTTAQEGLGESAPGPYEARSVGRRCDITAGRYKARFDWGPIVVSRDELAKRFRAWGRNHYPPFKDLVGVRKVEVFRSNAAGRPTLFAVEDTRGARFVLGAEQLRLAVNYDVPEKDKLPSAFVTPVAEGPNVRFKDGHGFGHGVGLCQWCIEAQARDGTPHERIVRDAYPGAVLLKGY